MSRPKPTEDDFERREIRAKSVRQFMKQYNFTEKRLADVLGLSRRSVQMIKAAAVTPTPDSVRKLDALFVKFRFKYTEVEQPQMF